MRCQPRSKEERVWSQKGPSGKSLPEQVLVSAFGPLLTHGSDSSETLPQNSEKVTDYRLEVSQRGTRVSLTILMDTDILWLLSESP